MLKAYDKGDEMDKVNNTNKLKRWKSFVKMQRFWLI